MRIAESNNIKEITPLLANVFLNDFDLTDNHLINYQQYYTLNESMLGPLGKYLNNQMSDSEVLCIESDEKRLKIVINDLNYCLMAEEIIRVRGLLLETKNLKFPCTFLFQDVLHYSINEIEINGQIAEIRDYSVIYNCQILFDQLIYIDKNTIEMALVLWKYSEGSGKNYLLLISAGSCSVLELQDEMLHQLKDG